MDYGPWTMDHGPWTKLPAKHPFPPPLRPLEHVLPLRVLSFVAQRATNLFEQRQMLVRAFEVGEEVELRLPLVAVGVVVEPAENFRDARFSGSRVTLDGTSGRILVRIEICVALERRFFPPRRGLAPSRRR